MRRLITLLLTLPALALLAPTAFASDLNEDAVEAHLDAHDIQPAALRTDVAKTCGFLTTKTFFGPGAADLEIHDFPVLDGVAECMITGDLAASNIAVVGYTSPAGPQTLNAALAADRAAAVKAYLVEQGVSPWRIETIATGELTASADDALEAPRDRRTELWVIQ